MNLRNIIFALCAIAAAFFSASLHAVTYTNPIIAEDAPDPSIIRGNDGYYYLFSTAEHVYRSQDLVKWAYLRQVFDGGKRPTFVEGVNTYWAPCVTKQDGRYVLYFALSTWGGGDTASIGVATSDTPEGPYSIVGDGKLFTSAEVGVNNSIDPNYIEYNGHKYIVWGSWNGIWLIELTSDGLAVKNIKNKRQIAGTRFEAPYIYRHGRYFYLFCSIGACCEGERSTYETVVGRANSLFGPYYTRDGKSMMDNNYELFLTSNTPCIAPGHNSRIIEDEEGRTWMTYHGYLRSDPDRGRVVWLDEVKWKSSWPYIEGKGASAEPLEGPVVNPYSLDVDAIHPEWGVDKGVLVPADLTNDGRMSLVIAGQQTDKSEVVKPWNTILRQNAEGQWTATQNGLQTGLNPAVVPADFNGDGQLELLLLSAPHETSNPDGEANGIYFFQPDSTFLRNEVQLEGASFAELTAGTVADVNRDGLPDIIAVGPQGKNLLLLASAENGDAVLRFRAEPFAGAETTYAKVLAADFDANGTTDLFAYSPTAAELFLGDGNGFFTPTDWTATCPVPTDGGVAIGDANYDSSLDIILSADSPILCLNDGTGRFTPSPVFEYALSNGNWSASAASLFDWDGNGYLDFLYQGESEALAITTGFIWYGNSSGVFSLKRRYGSGSMAATTFLDWNNDGISDLVTTGTTTDEHLFPFATGRLLSVTLNPNKTSKELQRVVQINSEVEGNVVHLSWRRGLKNQTYEVFVRNEEGRLFGNVRAHVDEPLAGQRKVLDYGNCGTAIETVMTLPPGNYTWGVQRVSPRFEGSPFRTGAFTIDGDAISDLPATASKANPVHFTALGQRVPAIHHGLHILRYPDGISKKVLIP